MTRKRVIGEISGYTITAPVYEDGDFSVYRASRNEDHTPVLIKVPASPSPSPSIIRRLEHEYEVARDLDPALVARPLGLERRAGALALVLEAGDVESLASRMTAPLPVGQFLEIAIGIADALAAVHQRGVVHKDIKPAHVLVDSTGRVWLTGFGIASRLPLERQAPEPPETIAGTLAYMAPEQTGRMNRSVDSRADLYSLGVTFYQMLTGVLPFDASDPMEWVHSQIARSPTPPRTCLPEIPEPLSDIVMRLLSKAAEERYQTASGLAADLRRCLKEWESQGRIDPFPLGAQDVSDRLLIPEKLYGRESEIDTLLAAFDRVVTSGNAELVLVSGYSGIGKSSVVKELSKVIVPPRGLFASGKFDQFKRDIPYGTLAQAFQTLVRQILGKSEAEVSSWRDALREALGPNGQLMVNLIPELELVIGKQPPVPDLAPRDTQKRFQMVLRRFLGVFARPEHPLALFLDDLQWLDAATLDLFEYLVTEPEVRHLLLLGAYRDNEVGPLHPLTRTMEAIRKTEARVQEMVLGPLMLEDICRLVADSLHCDRERAQPLAQLLHEKTGGNPFFAIQFFTELAEERLLAFDPERAAWNWDLAQIRAKSFTDNIVDLMLGKLNRLPDLTQEALKQLACLGNFAEIATLAMVHGESGEALHLALWAAVRAGLLFRWDDSYMFLHDRVQEAAYMLIPEGERASAHLGIGRLLTSRMTSEEVRERIFEIVGQFNRGAALISSPEERERLAELNLIAGRRAKVATANATALTYLVAGRALLPADSWERRYPLAFALEFHRAECEFLTGDMAAAEERLSLLSRRAGNLVDRAAVACLRMDLYMALDKSDRGIEVCLEYFRQLGVEWSPHPTKQEVLQEHELMWRQLGSRSIEDLINLPKMSDPDWRATIDVLIGVLAPAFFTDENLRHLIIGRIVNLSLEHGNSDVSAMGYVLLAMILGPKFGDYDAAFRFGKLGLELVENHGLDRFRARVYVAFGSLVIPWKKPLRTGRPFFQRAFDTATRIGDVTWAAYSCIDVIANLLASGDPLGEVQKEAESSLEFARKARFGLAIDIFVTQLQFIRTLRGLTQNPGSFDDGEFDESRFERHLASAPHLVIAVFWYWIRKLQACFYAGDYVSATAAAAKAERLLWTSPALIESADYYLFGALAQAAYHGTAPGDEKPELLKALLAHHKQIKVWAENCPENFENCAALVAAEIARIEDRELDAERLYEQAIRSAHENGFVQNEGIANELAAKFYTQRGFETIGHAYLREARDCYLRWGAGGKVKQLDGRHPWLAETKSLKPAATITASPEQLDVLAVAKAQQAISGEIVLDRLAETLLRIVLESAGAQKGYLSVEPELELLAFFHPGQGGGQVEFKSALPSPETTVAKSILNYVKRTRETVILSDASAEAGEFSTDEYLLRARPKSVLCMPVIRQAKLVGVLYLENNLAAGAFTPNRRAILEMLASQAAISLETAKLYTDLQRSQNDLQSQTRILQSILASIGDGVVVANERGEFLVYNPAAEAILGAGVTQGGPEGWTQHFGLYLPDQVTLYPPADIPLARAMRGESVDAAELFTRPPGRPEGVWLRVTARPLTDQTGLVAGGVAVLSDITARKRAEQEIRRLNAELEQRVIDRTRKLEAANKELESFSYSVSHDLRAPLRSIEAFSRILQDQAGKLDDEGRASLGKIRASTGRMTQLIDDMLQLSQVTLTELRRAPVDLSALARAVSEELRKSEPQRSVELIIEPNLTVQADGHLMRIVLENLIGNAWKFTGRQPAPRIEFGRDRDGAYFVRDNGAGFDALFAHKLFQVFQRLHTTSEFPGTGIGLATVQRVIDRHGGRVWAEGERGRGAAFFFTLPDGLGSK